MRPRLVAFALGLAFLAAGCFGGATKDASAGGEAGGDGDVPSFEGMPSVVVSDPGEAPSAWPWFPSNGSSVKSVLELPSFDAHKIPITVYQPAVANATQQVPVLLHSHGFTGKRAMAEDAFKELVAAGFGVVSFDERGHGESMDDSEVYFMHPDHEVQDVIKVIDHVATLDWVLKDGPGDPRLGAIGGSYGGAYQLMGAIFDPRLDAIVPEITWNDITTALAPNGVVKSGWVDLFYLAGNAQQNVRFSNDFHMGWAWAAATNTFPAGQTPVTPDLHTRLKESSPVSYPGALRVPTLLIQGMPDTLFPLNQAVDNLRALEAFGVPSALYTHLGGHILNTDSLRPGQVPVPVGLQGVAGGTPCGNLTALQTMWHQKWLLHLPVDTGPRVCLSLEDETNVVGETFPLEGTVVQEIGLAGPHPVAQAAAGPSISIPLYTAAEQTIVAGIPVVKGTITAAGADSIVFFSLKWADQVGAEAIVDDQVAPIRITQPVTSPLAFTLELGGVATRLAPGDELLLVVSTVEPMFAGNAERVPGAVVLGDLTVELPTLPADTPSLPAAT